MDFRCCSILVGVCVIALHAPAFQARAADFRAGAAVVDVTPTNLPVLVNGGMLSRSVGVVKTRVHARSLALADGRSKLVLTVVDSCMMGRALLDEAKALASAKTGIPREHLLVSATHAHSAPSSMGCLGTEADANYVPFLRDRIVEAIVAAVGNLEPARIGFGRIPAPGFNALRQWIRRPDRLAEDPFGNLTVRANMHAGANWDDVTGEAGPKDPELSMISVQSREGRPLAVLANFSMHYFSDDNLSADYFGLFAEGLKQRLAAGGSGGRAEFVGILSHGCSGDIWRRDYTRPETWDPKLTIERYASGLLDLAMKAHGEIRYREDVDLAMEERRIGFQYRVPDRQWLEWAQRIVAGMAGREAKTTTEVYAREQVLLHELQRTEVVVQALRIGDIGIAALPTETYAVTGLKLKAVSPLEKTMVIELANGGDGYVPPPEQHLFGGYNTWPARSAGLEVSAEPRLAEAAAGLLETVAGRPRREPGPGHGPAARGIVHLSPVAWWRLNDFTGPHALDASGNHRDAVYEPAVTFFLEGPKPEAYCGPGEVNRAPHFVGGRLRARLAGLGDHYALSLWVWNGMPNEGRGVAGWFLSRDRDHGLGRWGEHLGVGGTNGHPGRLIFQPGNDPARRVAGKSVLPRWEWRQVTLVREGRSIRVYLGGELEIETEARADFPAGFDQWFFGGRSDNDSNWEGRLDEIAVFGRSLKAEDIERIAVR